MVIMYSLYACVMIAKQELCCFTSSNYAQNLVSVLMVKFVWRMGTSARRGGWRCALVECGEVFAEMAGTRRMLILSVNSWT